MSSYRDEFLRLKWEDWVLEMVLRPILDPIDTLDVIFKNDGFSKFSFVGQITQIMKSAGKI